MNSCIQCGENTTLIDNEHISYQLTVGYMHVLSLHRQTTEGFHKLGNSFFTMAGRFDFDVS